LNDPRTRHAAFIAETPIDEAKDDLKNVALLKSLVRTTATSRRVEDDARNPRHDRKPA
jgi:hypothetical protein